MIGQPGYHRWRALPPLTLFIFLAQRSDRPAEVVAVHGEGGHRLMDLPVLAEAVRLPPFAGVPVSIGGVVPLHVGRADLVLAVPLAPHHFRVHPDDTSFLLVLLDAAVTHA